MKIAWFSEAGFVTEKLSRDFKNMRTEYAWYVAQQAHHYPISMLADDSALRNNSFDLGVIIIPKKIAAFAHMDIVNNLKRVCKSYAFMQEGASWYFQELHIGETFLYYDIMVNADFFLAHNIKDLMYYQSLLEKKGYINPTLMIEDSIKDISNVEREGVIIGGNIGHYYGGFNSLVVGLHIADKVYAPQMGRMKPEERSITQIEHLPYTEWVDWINNLNKFKYAVHMNPNTIAGTFNLNCAYLGIPCIGNIDADTQRMCFPELSIDSEDIIGAKMLLEKLRDDKDFYQEISETAKDNYKRYFSEEAYKVNWNNILKQQFDYEDFPNTAK